MRISIVACGAVLVLLAGCATQRPAPVIDKSRQSEHAYVKAAPACQARTAAEFCHVVERGDTLYSISRRYDLKVVEIASRNNIKAPFIIRPKELLVVRQGSSRPPTTAVAPQQPRVVAPAPAKRPSPQVRTTKPAVNPVVKRAPARVAPATPVPAKTAAKPPATRPIATQSPRKMLPQTRRAKTGWQWPVPYAPVKSSNQNGLDYLLADGTEIVAAITGKVIYAGAGLNKFRHLIIVDSGSSHLLAYEFNTNHAITEGQAVNRGQVITRIAATTNEDAAEPDRYQQFHFEIWANGKPLNPNTVIAR